MHPKHNIEIMAEADLPKPHCWNHSEVYRAAEKLKPGQGMVVSDLTAGQARTIYGRLKYEGFSIRRRVQNADRRYGESPIYQAIITRQKPEWEQVLEHEAREFQEQEDKEGPYSLRELKRQLDEQDAAYKRRQPKFTNMYAWTSDVGITYLVDFAYYPLTQHVVLTRIHHKGTGLYGDPLRGFADVITDSELEALTDHLVEDQIYLHS